MLQQSLCTDAPLEPPAARLRDAYTRPAVARAAAPVPQGVRGAWRALRSLRRWASASVSRLLAYGQRVAQRQHPLGQFFGHRATLPAVRVHLRGETSQRFDEAVPVV